jgi:uroporphyrinogen decarboxylase
MWLMRQAGRALPEYRELKQRHSFLELVQTPELAAEVTLQPIRRFGFDAAILFSDILVIAEALGQPYRFRDTGGIAMSHRIETPADIDRLETGAVRERLAYMAAAIRLLRRELGEHTALIGFAGAPWTVANFMCEGGSASPFTRAQALLEQDPASYARLAERLAAATVESLRMQIEAGVDAIQLFDTLAGTLEPSRFEAGSVRWLRAVLDELASPVPAIVFAKGANHDWPALAGVGAPVLGVDWRVRLSDVRRQLPRPLALQGNLDPAVLTATPAAVAAATQAVLADMRGVPGHIFNLGHGVPPDARLENIARLADTVRGFA